MVFAAWQLGRWHPDEVFQFLEPAWLRVHGYGIRAWEWEVGLRNWGMPLLYAWLLHISHALGIDHPRVYRAVLALPQLALHTGAVWAAWRYLARRLEPSAGRGWTAVAVALVAACGPVLLFSGRTLGEALSASLLLLAAERLERDERPSWDGAFTGLWLGLSVVVRYGSAVFVLCALLWLLATRRYRTLLWTCVSGGLVAVGLGLLDHLTWGSPFHSMREYLGFNVVSGEAARRFGQAPWWWYGPALLTASVLWSWPGVALSTWRERRLGWPAFAAGVYLLSISATAHKEARFVFPAVVLLALAGAPGWVWLLRRLRGRALQGLAVTASILVGLLPLLFAPDLRGDQFRAQVQASRDPEATGLLIVGDGLWGSGGYFYLGKNIPLHVADHAFQVQHILGRDRRVNRIIVLDERIDDLLRRLGFEEVDRIGRERIWVRSQGESG